MRAECTHTCGSVRYVYAFERGEGVCAPPADADGRVGVVARVLEVIEPPQPNQKLGANAFKDGRLDLDACTSAMNRGE